MMMVRKRLEDLESETLHEKAALSIHSKGRKNPEECTMRTCYQHDRDKILHCKSFKRLGHKTQVFLSPVGDHYSTRLTHTLEVSQIARSIAKALYLNDTLTEAISLGHDLGHTPFGHIGEQALNDIFPENFHHVTHGVRVVEDIEKLNLTREVINGIESHSKGKGDIISDNPKLIASTLEGQIVRLADIIAYLSHDLKDAVRGGLLKLENLPDDFKAVFKTGNSIDYMVTDVVKSTFDLDLEKVVMSANLEKLIKDMRTFMFDEVYDNTRANRGYEKIYKLIKDLYDFFVEHPEELDKESRRSSKDIGVERLACDFIAGMTDRFAINMYERIFIPEPWSVL